MPYDEDFFAAYQDYLNEPSVRRAHDGVFAMFKSYFSSRVGLYLPVVLDIGCGRTQEFRHHAPWKNTMPYVGVDLEPGNSSDPSLHQANYRTKEFAAWVQESGRAFTTLVSLFSSEITAPFHENEKLYDRLFRKIPSLRIALVAGFYYAGKKGENPVVETGGVTSWQTLSSIEEGSPRLYTEEARITLPVPSKMFGDDVVEVWRILVRKGSTPLRV